MPISNLNVSVESVELFVIGWDKTKFKGPTGVSQSIDIPVDDLILLLSKSLL